MLLFLLRTGSHQHYSAGRRPRRPPDEVVLSRRRLLQHPRLTGDLADRISRLAQLAVAPSKALL